MALFSRNTLEVLTLSISYGITQYGFDFPRRFRYSVVFRLIINEGLDRGTQIPYIAEGKARNFGIVVLNTNYNRGKNGKGESKYIRVRKFLMELEPPEPICC